MSFVSVIAAVASSHGKEEEAVGEVEVIATLPHHQHESVATIAKDRPTIHHC